MTPDFANGCFEFVSAAFQLKNVQQLFKDKKVAGVHWSPTLFFICWGLWNLFFYPHLNLWWSFWGGLFIVSVNIWWIIMVWKYWPSRSE